MGIRFVCNGEALMLIDTQGHFSSVSLPLEGEKIEIRGKTYRVLERNWSCDYSAKLVVTIVLNLVHQ